MINYKPFYKTLQKKEITTYRLINTYGVSRSLIDRLKHDKPITTVTINDLCTILNCKVEDILPVSYTHLDVYKRQVLTQ